jgi:hypothetical protein
MSKESLLRDVQAEMDAEYTVAEMQCAIQCAEPGTDAVGALLAFRKRAFPQRMQFIDAWKALKGAAADGKVPTGPCDCPHEHPTLRSYESDCFICVCCHATWTGEMLHMTGGGDKKTGRDLQRAGVLRPDDIQEMLDAAQNWPNANPAYGTVNRSPKAPSLSEVTAPNEPNRAAAEAQHKAHLAMIGEEFSRALDKDAVWTKTGDDTYGGLLRRGKW